MDGYEKLLSDLSSSIRGFSRTLKDEFEFQEVDSLTAKSLLNYNIKPIDLLYLLDNEQIKSFCQKMEISTRGSEVLNILDQYKDTENLYLENYVEIASRDLASLKENGIQIKESELGLKFEDLTKKIFEKLGFNVDETLKKGLNTAKLKVDIVLNMGNNELILLECKSKKEKGYNNYSSVARQVKSYKDLVEKQGYRSIKTFIIAPDFTDDFIKECGLDYDLNLSLIGAESLMQIYSAFKDSGLKSFPYKLLLRDVQVDEERVIKAITR
ncbi:MAG: hypothetical protein AAF502_13085 [Bacteroidota bacterium]